MEDSCLQLAYVASLISVTKGSHCRIMPIYEPLTWSMSHYFCGHRRGFVWRCMEVEAAGSCGRWPLAGSTIMGLAWSSPGTTKKNPGILPLRRRRRGQGRTRNTPVIAVRQLAFLSRHMSCRHVGAPQEEQKGSVHMHLSWRSRTSLQQPPAKSCPLSRAGRNP
jgi:hypothetical protein